MYNNIMEQYSDLFIMKIIEQYSDLFINKKHRI